MAANMKAVKLRIKSVESTMQITKAMELVASSKLRKAKERAEVSRPYFQALHKTLEEIAKGNTDFTSVYAAGSKSGKYCYVVIAGDRGLAGGYNANLFKCLEEKSHGKEYTVLPIGKKAVEYFQRKGIPCPARRECRDRTAASKLLIARHANVPVWRSPTFMPLPDRPGKMSDMPGAMPIETLPADDTGARVTPADGSVVFPPN